MRCSPGDTDEGAGAAMPKYSSTAASRSAGGIDANQASQSNPSMGDIRCPSGLRFSILKRRRERPTKLERPRPVARASKGGGAEKLRYRLGKHAETLGVLEGIAAHVSDDAISRVLDLVEEGAPRRDVVDRPREGVDVGARIELDRIE